MSHSSDVSDGAVTSEPLSKRQRGAHPEPSIVSFRSNRFMPHPHLNVLQRVKDKHKTSMKHKYQNLFERIDQQENQTLLYRINTQLYIIEGESEEHEISRVEKKSRRTQRLQDIPIYCNDIFKPLPEPYQNAKIKTVLTKGITGIGKTVSVQKFILDWAEGTANQDIDFMFVLPFRELNLIRDKQYSLHKLLLDFHPELQDLDSQLYEGCKVVFIFDGLDECRMIFSARKKVFDVTKTSSVQVLMSNLMRGDLLPSALIWITSRPAADNQFPLKYITCVTEIQGFSDAQKEEYIWKRVNDQHQASRIISRIKRARSLHHMCHIPVFCWITSTVLQNILKQDDDKVEIPQTLTEMYIQFLLMHINAKNQKYDPKRDPEIQLILKLAEVAFKQLMKGNVMFSEDELRECGITDYSLHSGICSEIFEESVIHKRKMYCFTHLSFQEFLAAFYAFHCHLTNNTEPLRLILNKNYDYCDSMSEEISLYQLLDSAVDKSLQSKTGHLDLFLRFLMGISLESNQRLLQDFLTRTRNSSNAINTITQYVLDQIKSGDDLSTDRSIDLFLCVFEVSCKNLNREIEEFVRSGKKLSAAHCSAIAYMLQMSEEVMDEFDLRKYNTTQEGRRRLLPAVINCRRALLQSCSLSAECCESLSSCLQSSKSLKELDLSNNELKDSGAKVISDALKSNDFQLHTLRLSGCMVTDEGCCYLASALDSNPSHIIELDLSYNHPEHTGRQLLSDKLNDPSYTLNKLNVDHGGMFRIRAGPRKWACDLTLDPNTANTSLVLSEKNRKITRVSEFQPYPDLPGRFDDLVHQVLSRECLPGRCYWEAEWRGSWVSISVSYNSISRKEADDSSMFGFNEKSWSLYCADSILSAFHNNSVTNIPVPPHHCKRVGVYVDWSAGTLSFYNVSDSHTLTHIHTFNTTFTEPLHAGFGVFNSSLSLCDTHRY
ncbi:NLR family CARD domain-containing protein 3-like [Triplophysa dalaica]|uniref:NLR family CARD domain-containing protein 3-like n=1 Tax=Triplophysa dalaica TaxID=1582913 RepID=UPI0024DFCB87|nr:NLR family CARD domain-containing protein 3-like [Triplophysa dalaica]